jgi:formate C-acetyltransferase
MNMNERIRKLREKSLQAAPSITADRAMLVTEFYREHSSATLSPPMKRALAFRHLLERKTVSIDDGELIVGERGPAPKSTPTYPEITAHSLQDLDILNSRPKTSFKVDPETRKRYEEEIIPFWRGQTIREKIFAEMDTAWKDAYEAGVFTEFMEQRAPGHTVLDDKIYRKGFADFQAEVRQSIGGLDFRSDPEAFHKKEELEAMSLAAEAIVLFAERYAGEARRLAALEKEPQRKAELLRIAEARLTSPGTHPATSGKPSRPIGSFISALSSSSTPGTPSIPADWTSTSIPSTRGDWKTER